MHKWRILVVDDEEDIRSIIRAALSQKYEVVEACKGKLCGKESAHVGAAQHIGQGGFPHDIRPRCR